MSETINISKLTPALRKYMEKKQEEEKTPLIRYMEKQEERGQLLSSADMQDGEDTFSYLERKQEERKARKERTAQYNKAKDSIDPAQAAETVKSVSFRRLPQQTASQQFVNQNDVNGKKILAVHQNNREALAKNIAESDLESYRRKEAERAAKQKKIDEARPVSKVQEDIDDIDKNIKKAKKDAFLGEFSMLLGNQYPHEQATERLSWLEGERDRYADELEFSRYAEYEKLRKSEDYEENSQYSTTAKSTKNNQAVASLNDYSDWQYEYINQNPAVVMAVEALGTDVSYLKQMSDDEVGMYNYLYKTNGKEAAEDYIDSLQDDLYVRQREQSVAKYSEFAQEHPVLASVASVPMNMLKGITFAAQAADDLFTGEADPNAPYNAAAYNTNAIRKSVSALAEEKWGKPGSFAYGIAMSMADFLAANAVSGGTGAAKLILGSGAAADTTISAIERGVDSNAAVVLGATAGVIEALTEEASIEALFKSDWTKKAIKHIFKNIVTEGSEEGASTILNTLADILISGDKSEWEISVAAYMDDGYSEKDAFKNTFLDKLKEIGLDVLGGAISGGLMGSGSVAINQTGKAAANASEKYSQFETLREAVKQDNARREFEFTQDGVEQEGFVLPTAADAAKSAEAKVESDLDAGLKEDTVPRAKTYEETVLEKKIAKATTTAERSGLRLGVSEADIKTAKFLGLRTGRNVVFYSDATDTGKIKDGYINHKTNTIYVNKDAGAQKATAQVLGHELSHSTEGTEAYDLLEQKALESLIRKGINPDAERERIKQLYERAGINLATDEQVDGEIVAKYVEENLINNRAAVRELVRENPSAARKFKMALAKMLTKVTGNENYIDYKTITSMQNMIDDAAKETANPAKTKAPVSEARPTVTKTAETEVHTEFPAAEVTAEKTEVKKDSASEAKTEDVKKPSFETAAGKENTQSNPVKGVNKDSEAKEKSAPVSKGTANQPRDSGYEISDNVPASEFVHYINHSLLMKKITEEEADKLRAEYNKRYPAEFHEDAIKKAFVEYEEGRISKKEFQKIYDENRSKTNEINRRRKSEVIPVRLRPTEGAVAANPEIAARETSAEPVGVKTASAEKTEQNTKSKADEPMPSGWDEYLDSIVSKYEAGELSEEEYEEAYSAYEEARDTGVPFDKSSIMVEDVEGKIPGAIRKAVEVVTGGKKSAEQMQEVRADVESGKSISGTDEVAYSIAYDEEYMRAAEEMNRELKKVPVNVMANAQRARAVIREIFTNPKLKDALNLPPENIGNTYIPNGAYDGTEENTTVCIRSLAADALMDAVAEHLGRPLNVEDTMTVSQEYWQYTDQPECLYCYVAMDRKAYREYLGSYLQQRSDVLKNIHDGMDTEDAYKIFLDGRKPTTQMRGRFDSWVKYDRDGSAMITAADLASDKAMNAAIARDPSLLEQINDARKYAQGASWAKKRIGYTAYNNHILKWTDDRVRKLNSQYGLRMYSFSDFSPAFILENMQMITDAAVRGLKMLGYTKDLNFVRIFAPSGININISTFAYEQNGEFVQDGMQGADWAEAQKLRDQYGNVGITFVAVNDAQVEWAMAQGWVDTVIPFHLVRTGSKVAEHFGWTNYTQMSSDVKGEGWKKGGKKSVFPSEHQNNYDKYMAALENHHLEPRFAKWIDNPNYMKLVNETRLSAGETKPVRPEFDVDAAEAAIDEMIKRGGYYTPIGKTDENMREIAGEIADKIRADEGVQWSVSEVDETSGNGEEVPSTADGAPVPPKSLQDVLPTQATTRMKRAEHAFAESMREMFELSTEGYYTEFLQSVHAISKDVILNGGNPDAAISKLFTDFNTATEAAMEAWQYSQFDRSAKQFTDQLNTIKRYAESRAKAATPEKARQNYTAEDAEKMFEARRDAQKNLDRVKARALLTEEDKLIIGQIKRGERSVDQLSPAEYNVEDIRAVAEAEMAFDEADKLISIYKKQIKAGYLSEAEDALKNIKSWKDKATLAYLRETIERNFRDIIPDKAEAAAFEKQYIKPVHKAEADKQRALSDYRERVKALNLKEKPAKGEFVSESYAVQLLGEAEDNIRILEKMRNPETKRDGKTLEEWKSAVEYLWADNPSLDQTKIRNAVKSFKQTYDELLKQMNQVLLENGYPPVRYRSGYFPHFTVGSEDAVMAKFSRFFGIKLDVNPLPTSINGLTQDFKPGKAWFGHALERTGFETTYDAVAGFEQYVGGALDVIYHTKNIQKFRALASQIRWLSADEGIKKQHQDIVNDDTLTEEQQESLIRDLYAKGRYRMSNLVQYIDEYTNRLANKKMRLDRSMEELFGRKFYTVMQNLESRVAANMIGANIGSALTNIIPLNQAGAIIGNRYVLRGLWDTMQNAKDRDGFVAMSDFLVNRRGSAALGRTGMQKFTDVTGIPMQFIDDIVSEAVVRAAYYKNLKNGMSEETALEHADETAASIMADRSKGALPLLFDVKNPVAKLFTQFQVEVNNEFSVIFKDIPKEAKEKGLGMLAWLLLKYFVGAKIFNDFYEKILGRRPAFDPLEMVNDAVGGFTGYQLPNALDLFEEDAWVAEKINPSDAIAEFGANAAESLPFVGGVLGGGRVPIQSALPDLNNLLNAATNNEWSTKHRLSTLYKELIKPAAYLLPPAAGGAGKKLLETAAAAARGGVYGVSDTTLDDGTVVGEESLKYPFYTDSAVETAINFARSLMGGTSTTSGGVEWVESGFKGITASETKVYKEMLANGTSQHDAWDAIQRVKNIPKGGMSPTAEKCKAIADSGLNYRSALALYNNKVSDKHGDAIAQVMSKGISFDDYLLARAKYAELDYDENLSLFEKTVKMRNWAVQKFPSSKEKQNAIEDVFEFKQVFMSGASDTSIVKNYRGMLESGISESTAIDIANAVASLEPLEGKTTVSAAQKARAVLNTVEDDGYREAALQTVLGNNYKKYGIAHDLGVGFDAYTAFREALPSFDEDGNGSYTNAEVSRAIDAISGIMSPEQMIMMLMSGQSLPELYALTNEQKAVIWQLATGSTSAKNNPYSTSTGNMVLKMLGKAE